MEPLADQTGILPMHQWFADAPRRYRRPRTFAQFITFNENYWTTINQATLTVRPDPTPVITAQQWRVVFDQMRNDLWTVPQARRAEGLRDVFERDTRRRGQYRDWVQVGDQRVLVTYNATE